ncbi:MAG: penicillin-binding protein 1C [Pseudomonadota bacterium]
MRRLVRVGLFVVFAAGLGWWLIPRPELYGHVDYSTAWLDRHGKLLRLELAADERYRLKVPLEAVSPAMQQATLLYEDQDYYDHDGVDLFALLRAAWQTYVIADRRIGGSTLTMQVARLRYGHDHTLLGKMQQILRAIQIERHYNKREILAAYFNLAPYGRNIEGVEAAGLIYFDKPAAELTLPEALALSVVPQNPVRRNPTSEAGFAELARARTRLFERWVEAYPEDARRRGQIELPLAVRPPEALPFHAPHFVNGLEAGPGSTMTTLDLSLQKMLAERVARYVERRGAEGIRNATALLLNSETMEVEALVGSADFFNDRIAGQVDGTRAKRSPGSALKPFVYALAIDQGLIHPMSMLKDSPKRYGAYTPENFDQHFLGPVLAKDALIKSRNVPAVNLTAALKKPGLYGFLHQAGIGKMHEPEYYGLALALGGMEVSMHELVRLYALLANGGRLKPITSLLDDKPVPKGEPLLSDEAAFITLKMLEENPPPGRNPMPGMVDKGLTIPWKTGTSYAFRDAWAVGIGGPYVLAVWVGNFDGEGNPAFVGRTAAGPLLFDLFAALSKYKGEIGKRRASHRGLNVKRIAMCADTGDLPGRYCPRSVPGWFIPGVSPIKVSTVHRAIPIDKTTGKRACYYDPKSTRYEIYEFWPSDLLTIFRQAGIARRLPPPFLEGCPLAQQGNTGAAPWIATPSEVITYTLRVDRLANERIPFEAVSEADVETLYWFVDNRLVGQVRAGEVFFWPAAAGDFTVTVLDDHGRASDVRMTVRLVN